ncbi:MULTISPECIES: GNAT family N-acetyltransferase [Moorena]|uniref:Putative acetyltransferase n=1 Tax=Moorena producens 3L TaxID=489825 RepID=F4XNJ7_9CYAN|nr:MULTISPECIES: GNAT family N-acetyltransferase [Moorena]NES84074.1 GNAT family N-acetyltransferase [Moorena sp. SIO2B7]EGJ34256.1 putative acetyltransferase [Moorena producens 3L]NEP32872.1 GNAT family N-acetyltransferase [Moorena sp. SIO3B2]NEP69163.1 GNAT family N-acetyltransferase [Moorena sp. SIO3A5]NER90860.1 GNAT family N-acetyltransferase [Moorena sp. SIO3A2]
MTLGLDYSPVDNSQDLEQIGVIISQCFGVSVSDCEAYIERIGTENFRIIRQAGNAIAHLAIYPMAQWYGGKPVPMAGVAVVGVAPEYRGQGVAYQLMAETIMQLHDQGVPISTLYASTDTLYRKVGYQRAGNRCLWKLSTKTISLSERNLPMHRVEPENYQIFEEIYHQQAQANNGNLDRHHAIWKHLVKPIVAKPEETIYSYLIGSETLPEGYIIFTQQEDDHGLRITIDDWALLTTAAIKRFWTFIADHRSLVKQVYWYSSPHDPLMLLLPEQTAKIDTRYYWMSRVIDVPKALEKRGYPVGIDGELHLEVEDDLISANNGRFRLRVNQGQGEVTPGGNGDLQISIRGLASLYTGLYSPRQLQLTGYLKATNEALSVATLLFSGSEPWMPDMF